METRHCLILNQDLTSDTSKFTGKFFQFDVKVNSDILSNFNMPSEFIYYDSNQGSDAGYFYGWGKIAQSPFPIGEGEQYFVEISEYKRFSKPVPLHAEEFSTLIKGVVSEVSCQKLDEICLDGGIVLNFEADAHLVQILGEQLIASERVGILELVKNGFDAGATYSKVRIEKVPQLKQIPDTLYQFNDYPGPVIVIEDNGSGMSRREIELGWLRPASTLKTAIKERIKLERERAIKSGKKEAFEKFLKVLRNEHSGRVPLGEKGVGRFACHRLGRFLTIKTKTRENDFEYVLNINWDDFETFDGKSKNLNSVALSLFKQPLSREYGETRSGTQLIIYGGRPGFELDEKEVREINRTILKLNTPQANPLKDTPQFKAIFECPQVTELDEGVDYQAHNPVFTVSGIVSETGLFDYELSFNPPYSEKIPLSPFQSTVKEFDLRNFNKEYWREDFMGNSSWREAQCGSFYIHIDIWYRDKPWRDNLDKDFLKHLQEYGGISVYRDGINVFTAEWGAESDWLGLRQRQIQQARRISYYHMIGNVEIEQGENILLIDKTNREGMIGNRAFKDLQELVKGVVFLVENEYMGKREELNRLTGGIIGDPQVVHSFSKDSAKIISNVHDKYDIKNDPYQLLSELGSVSNRRSHLVELSKSLQNLEKNLHQIQEVQDMLTEQAGFGLGIAVALHEISKTTSNFYFGILDVIKNQKFDSVKLEELKDASQSLENEIKRLAPLRALRNEDSIQFNVSQSVRYVCSMFKRRLEKLQIDFQLEQEDDFQILARYGALNQVLTNLFDNSCYWLDNPRIVKRVIRIKVIGSERAILFADSGYGIDESILPYLFQPGYSLKFPPSGLGLYVCKHYLNMMKKRGDIYLARDRDRFPDMSGAQFLLDFSKVKDSSHAE